MRFPLFVELEGRPCLVVGGGRIAARKAAMLGEFGAAVTVVAPAVDEALVADEVLRRTFEDGDVDGRALVVAATDDAALNARVSRLCKARGVLVNVVDDPANCTFVFPAICRKGPVVAAVSSGGAAPVAAKLVRDKIAKLLPDDFVAAVERLGEEREDLKRRYPDMAERRRHCEEVLRKWKD